MNLAEIIKNIQRVTQELYPSEPEVSKLCEALITWERGNISKAIRDIKNLTEKFWTGSPRECSNISARRLAL